MVRWQLCKEGLVCRGWWNSICGPEAGSVPTAPWQENIQPRQPRQLGYSQEAMENWKAAVWCWRRGRGIESRTRCFVLFWHHKDMTFAGLHEWNEMKSSFVSVGWRWIFRRKVFVNASISQDGKPWRHSSHLLLRKQINHNTGPSWKHDNQTFQWRNFRVLTSVDRRLLITIVCLTNKWFTRGDLRKWKVLGGKKWSFISF